MTVIVSGGYASLDEDLLDARPGETFDGYCARH
jgi:hypothetical protein